MPIINGAYGRSKLSQKSLLFQPGVAAGFKIPGMLQMPAL
jgi:hypothetical protein